MKNRLGGVTLTGIDEWTKLYEWNALEAEFPNLETAILYCPTRKMHNRQPERATIRQITSELLGSYAIHICGPQARMELLEGGLDDIVGSAGRIQINGRVEPMELRDICEMYRSHEIITQHNPESADLLHAPFDNHTIVVDASGGMGVSPKRWERPVTSKWVGFAGGLGPENIAQELPKIAKVAKGNYWIDMEGKLRTNDRFDVKKARQVLETVQQLTPEFGA